MKSNVWADQLMMVLQHAHIDFDINDNSLIDLEALRQQYLILNRQKWLLEASDKTKLRTFLEVYDAENPRAIIESLLPRNHRSLISKIKTGVLPLHIETGRWKDKPIENRLCMACNSGNLENEYHFLGHCEAYEEVREEFVTELVNRGVEVSAKSDQDFVKSILQKGALKTTGKYVEIMYGMRKDLMQKKGKK